MEVGMAMMANRYPRIYAAVAWSEQAALKSREHNNANVLVIPSDFVTPELAVKIIHRWLTCEFKKGRYQERIDMINAL